MRKIALKYGLWMLAGFIALFIVMYLIGLAENVYLRVMNGFVHIGFIWAAIRKYRERYPESVNNYVSGVAAGMWASLFGVVGFVIFMFFFFVFSPGFLESVKAAMPIGNYLNPLTATLFIFAEGVVISLIGSYVVTRVVDMRMANVSSYHS